jgi:CrcB protein
MILGPASVPTAVVIGLGGAAGALARYAVDLELDGGRQSTFAVNVLGSALLGALVAYSPSDVIFAAAGTGFCGAFTTFSSFAVTVARTAADGRPDVALVDAVRTLIAALVGVGVGWTLVGLW